MNTVSIIIPTYNTSSLTLICIESLLKYKNNCTIDITIIDNGNDNTLELINKKFPNVKTIKNLENVGYGRAINQGINSTVGSYILMLNSDTLAIHHYWLDNMIRLFEYDDKVAVVGNRLINKNDKLVGCGVVGTNKNPRIRGWMADNIGYTEPIECISVCGACYLIKRSNIEVLGLLDEYLIFYFEETSYSYNARRNGFKVMYCPDSTIVHYHQGSCKDNIWLNQQFQIGKKHFDEKFADMMGDNRIYG